MRKKQLATFAVLLSAIFFLTHCDTGATNDEKTEMKADEQARGKTENHVEEKAETETKENPDGSLTTIAKYIEGSCLEGEAHLVFEKEDGDKMEFNHVMSNSEKLDADLDFAFIEEDGMSAEKETLGKMFKITYKLVEKGCWDEDGNETDCNKIQAVEKIEQ